MHPDTQKLLTESLHTGLQEIKEHFEDLDGGNKHTFSALQLKQEHIETMHKISQGDLLALVNDLKAKL